MGEANVFGKPVTAGADRKERALEALTKPNADGKRGEAIDYLRQQKDLCGKDVTTLCLFYNATGETLAYSKENSKYGDVYDSYPTRVQNGQWGAFLHAGEYTYGSSGFVVYRVKNNDTDHCSQLLCWETPGYQNANNHAYCNIFDDGEVDSADQVYKKMEHSSRKEVVKKLEMLTVADIEEGSSPVYEAQLTRDDAMGIHMSLFATAEHVDVEPSSAT